MYDIYQNYGGNDTVPNNFPAVAVHDGTRYPRYGTVPNNTNVTTKRLAMLSCPSDKDNAPSGNITNSNYAGVTGNAGTTTLTAGPSPQPTGYVAKAGYFDPTINEFVLVGTAWQANTRKTKLTDATDGLSNTVLFGEVLQGQGSDLRGFIWWGDAAGVSTYYPPNTPSPDQVSSNCVNDPANNLPCVTGATPVIHSVRSRHTGGANVGLGDGSVRFVSNSVNPLMWIWAGSMSDGQVSTLN